MNDQYGDISVTKLDGNVAQCEIRRPPNNFFDHKLIMDLADCFEDIEVLFTRIILNHFQKIMKKSLMR